MPESRLRDGAGVCQSKWAIIGKIRGEGGWMKQLWAPWRMPFIEGQEPVEGCLFCNKGREDEDVQNHVVHRTDHCFTMLNLYPYNSGHLMVVPYAHVGQLDELTTDDATALVNETQIAIRVLRHAMKPEGFNVGVNQGRAAGAGIADHIHLHIVPRWNGYTNFMPVLTETKVMPELL